MLHKVELHDLKRATTIEIQFTHMGMAPKGAYSEAFKEATKGKT